MGMKIDNRINIWLQEVALVRDQVSEKDVIRSSFKAGAKWLLTQAEKLEEDWRERYETKYDDYGNITETKTIEYQVVAIDDLKKLVGEE